MVTARLLKWQAPVEMELSASDLDTIADFLSKENVQDLIKDNWSMKSIAKQIITQSEKVQDALNPSYNS